MNFVMSIFQVEPAQTACCGLSLRSAVTSLIVLDVTWGTLGLAVLFPFLMKAGPSAMGYWDVTLSSLITVTVLVGSFAGIMGLNQNKSDLIRSYAMTRLMRIGLSLMLTFAMIYYSSELVSSAVDQLIQDIVEQAKSEGREVPVIDRDRMIREMTAGFVSTTLFWELLTDAAALYFAYITKSLADRMKGDISISQVSQSAPLLQERME